MSESSDLFAGTLGFIGAMQHGFGPESWGISLEQLRAVTDDPSYVKENLCGMLCESTGSSTMREVVERIVKPATAGTGMGYALLKNEEKPLRARVMVSHAWDEEFHEFLQAIVDSGIEGPFWVCAFAIYQPEDLPHVTIEQQLGPHPSTGPFATVLKQADVMLAVLTGQCNIYTRMWCVLEMFTALQLGLPVRIAQYMRPYSQDVNMPFLHQCATAVDSAAARCGNPANTPNSDEIMIRQMIEAMPGGFLAVDHAIEASRLDLLQKCNFVEVLVQQNPERPLSPKIGMIIGKETTRLQQKIRERLGTEYTPAV